MSAERVIQAQYVDHEQVESFPYFAAHFSTGLDSGLEDDDASLGSLLSSPEEDAMRLASVDQVIYQKLQQAEREAQDTARRGYEEGFASGELEGRAFGESQFRAHLQRLDSHLQELSASLALNDKAAKDELLALAMALGQYLAGREIHQGAQTIAPLLDAMLAANPFPSGPGDGPEPTAITVHMNPRDLEELGAASQLHPGVTLREDPDLSRGGLRLVSAIGVLDASLERRQAKLLQLIQTWREQENP